MGDKICETMVRYTKYQDFEVMEKTLRIREKTRIYQDIRRYDSNGKNLIYMPLHSSFTIMQGFAKWGRVRHNMAESLGITTV